MAKVRWIDNYRTDLDKTTVRVVFDEAYGRCHAWYYSIVSDQQENYRTGFAKTREEAETKALGDYRHCVQWSMYCIAYGPKGDNYYIDVKTDHCEWFVIVGHDTVATGCTSTLAEAKAVIEALSYQAPPARAA